MLIIEVPLPEFQYIFSIDRIHIHSFQRVAPAEPIGYPIDLPVPMFRKGAVFKQSIKRNHSISQMRFSAPSNGIDHTLNRAALIDAESPNETNAWIGQSRRLLVRHEHLLLAPKASSILLASGFHSGSVCKNAYITPISMPAPVR
jgi:hypothetical protein